MAFNFNRPGSDQKKASSLGNIALEIQDVGQDVDKSANSITGINISTGEEMTIRLANQDEFARMYVPRRFSSPAEREAEAQRAVGSRNDVAGITKSSFDEAVVQFDDVRETRGGDLVARWAGSLTTNSPKFAPETAVNAVAEATSYQYTDKDGAKQDGMKVTAVLVDQAFPAEAPGARERMDKALSGQVGNLPEFQKTGLLVTVSEPGNDTDKNYAVLSRQKDANKDFITGLEANVTRSPVGRIEAIAQTAVAASVDIPFERLNMDKASPDDREWLKGLYEAVKQGDVKVSVAPSFESGLMPMVEERLQKQEKNSNGLLNRGFADMNLGVRAGSAKPDGTGNYDANVREVKPAGFMPDKNADSFVKDRLDTVASRVIDAADQKREQMPSKVAEKAADEQQNYGAPAL